VVKEKDRGGLGNGSVLAKKIKLSFLSGFGNLVAMTRLALI